MCGAFRSLGKAVDRLPALRGLQRWGGVGLHAVDRGPAEAQWTQWGWAQELTTDSGPMARVS